MTNFEVLCLDILSSINLLFLKSVHTYNEHPQLHIKMPQALYWPVTCAIFQQQDDIDIMIIFVNVASII